MFVIDLQTIFRHVVPPPTVQPSQMVTLLKAIQFPWLAALIIQATQDQSLNGLNKVVKFLWMVLMTTSLFQRTSAYMEQRRTFLHTSVKLTKYYSTLVWHPFALLNLLRALRVSPKFRITIFNVTWLSTFRVSILPRRFGVQNIHRKTLNLKIKICKQAL